MAFVMFVFMFIELFFVASLGIWTLASPLQAQQGEAKVVTSCVESDTVALTFDDGPWVYLYDVSKALTDANATGTFFFNGNNYACIYDPDSVDRVLYAYQHGHQIGSHTWGHKDLTTLSWDNIHNEMWLVEQAFQKIVGVTPAFMRPPYGNYNDLVRQAAYIRGQALALWDFDSGDSTGSTPEQSEDAYEQLISKRPSNILALNHETEETTAHQVLPFAIQKLQSAGYKLVSLSECTGLPAYQGAINSPGVRDSSWHC